MSVPIREHHLHQGDRVRFLKEPFNAPAPALFHTKQPQIPLQLMCAKYGIRVSETVAVLAILAILLSGFAAIYGLFAKRTLS
jgi:hypothetical protein